MMVRMTAAVIAALLLAGGVVAAQGGQGPGDVPRLPSLPPPGAGAPIPAPEGGVEGAYDDGPTSWDDRPPEGGLAKLPLDNSSPRRTPRGPPGAWSQALTALLVLGAVLSALFLWYARALRRQQER